MRVREPVRWAATPRPARVLVLALALVLAACGGGADGGGAGEATGAAEDLRAAEAAVETAEAYFAALADLDYDAMARLSTGLANTAARYGQQVLAADPRAFSARDVEVVEPFAARPDADELDGALDLISKGIPGPPLRIRDVEMAETGEGYLVSAYTRDGRALDEVFRELDLEVELDGVAITADLVLTDGVAGVLLLPVTVRTQDQEVEVEARGTRVAGSGPPLDHGAGVVQAGKVEVLALTFRDVADPAAVEAVEVALRIGRQRTTATLRIR